MDIVRLVGFVEKADLSAPWLCAQVRAFDFRTGKLRRKYDESRRAMEDMIASGQLKMDAMDLGKKSAVEKELEVIQLNRTQLNETALN